MIDAIARRAWEIEFGIAVSEVYHDAIGNPALWEKFHALRIELRRQVPGAEHLDRIEGLARDLREEEPSTYWAVYADAWNRVLDWYGCDGPRRRVHWLGRLLGRVVHFTPDAFPEVQS